MPIEYQKSYQGFSVYQKVVLVEDIKCDGETIKKGTEFTITKFPPKTFMDGIEQPFDNKRMRFAFGRTNTGTIIRAFIYQIKKV